MELLDKILKISPVSLTYIYGFGSFYYGTFVEGKSDYDFICITDDEQFILENSPNPYQGEAIHFDVLSNQNDPHIDLHIYTMVGFKQMVDQQDIRFIEALYNPILEGGEKIKFVLDKQKLRSSLSSKCSNSWIKAKKKLTIEKDYNPYIAQKSLFHCLRMYDFGVQLGDRGVIKDWNKKALYDEIMDLPEDKDAWHIWDAQFRPRKNALATEFKKFLPKN